MRLLGIRWRSNDATLVFAYSLSFPFLRAKTALVQGGLADSRVAQCCAFARILVLIRTSLCLFSYTRIRTGNLRLRTLPVFMRCIKTPLHREGNLLAELKGLLRHLGSFAALTGALTFASRLRFEPLITGSNPNRRRE